eukprot:6099981-Amphidinium_carterae.1
MRSTAYMAAQSSRVSACGTCAHVVFRQALDSQLYAGVEGRVTSAGYRQELDAAGILAVRGRCKASDCTTRLRSSKSTDRRETKGGKSFIQTL